MGLRITTLSENTAGRGLLAEWGLSFLIESDGTTILLDAGRSIVASHNADFYRDDNQMSYVPFWVSDLALITRSRDSRLEGFLLNANTGEAIKGAEIKAW